MGNARSTVYNMITSEDKIKLINQNNMDLANDFIDYLASIDRSIMTQKAYRSDLMIFFVFVLEHLNNKDFQDITKREFARFQSHCLNEWGWSPKRMRRVKAVISSMSNYIENILMDEDDEFADFKKSIHKIESPANVPIREKTVLTDDEVQLLLDTLLERGAYEKCCVVAILAYSGMRKAELLQMKPEYFNEDHIVFGSLYQTDTIRGKGRGKNGHQMKKWIMIQAEPYITPWLKQREELGVDCEWLFVVKDGNGNYVRRETIDHFTEDFSSIVGKQVYPHSFRHFTCTKLLSDYNLPSEVVREYFQWGSVEMLRIYNDKSAVDDFGKYFTSEGVVKQEEKSLSDL